MMKFVGTGLGAMVTTVSNMVGSMHGGRCPKFPGGREASFMKDVATALARLCTAHIDGKQLFGKEALAQHWKVVEALRKRTVTDLRVLNRFSFLLDDAKKTQLRVWDDNVMDPKEVAMACAAPSGSSSSSSAS